MADPFDIESGKTIPLGRYRIEEKLGKGGMGVVYKAYDAVLENFVAIKALPEHLKQDHGAIERLKKEAKLTQALKHPNIMALYNFENFEGNSVLICEYILGKTLDELKRERPEGKFNYEEAINYICQACDALDYAHSQGIIHRDIKPANIMVRPDGQVVVTDFGIAQIVRDSTTQITGRPLIGTLRYMSPEQIMGQRLDERSDIYSLGITLYELLNGEPPFISGDIIYQHIHKEPDAIEGIPEAINSIVQRALAKNPSNRFASSKEFKEALVRKRPIEPIVKPKKESLRRKVVSVGGKLFLLITLLGAGLMLGENVLYRARQQREEEAKRQQQEAKNLLEERERQESSKSEEAIPGQPLGSAKAYTNRGAAYANKGLYDQAISDYNKALEINPRFELAYLGRGAVYGEKGFYDQAISEYNQVLEVNPSSAVAYFSRGMAYADKGLYDEAISDFNKALEIDLTYADAYYGMADTCEKAGRIKEAIEAYRKFIQHVSKDDKTRINYAQNKIHILERQQAP